MPSDSLSGNCIPFWSQLIVSDHLCSDKHSTSSTKSSSSNNRSRTHSSTAFSSGIAASQSIGRLPDAQDCKRNSSMTAETRAKIAAGCRGKHHTEAAKQKIREAQIRIHQKRRALRYLLLHFTAASRFWKADGQETSEINVSQIPVWRSNMASLFSCILIPQSAFLEQEI